MSRLEIDHVTVRFGGITAVDGASLMVEPGRVQGLMGPNGAGKTTLFNVITGLEDPDEGRVVLDGEDVTRISTLERARRGVGRTFQKLEVFGSLTVRENVRVAAEMHRTWDRDAPEPDAVADELLELVGVGAFADVPADSVPTGIARLTELGRALAIDPTVLLLDEPSSGLNEEETMALGELLVRLAAEGRAVLLVEHDVDLVMETSEHIDVLDFGRIIARGIPEEIQADPTVQEAYLGAEVDEAEPQGLAG